VWRWKKCISLKNSKLLIIKLNTFSIPYSLGCQRLLSLSRYYPQFYGNYGSINSSSEWHSTLSQNRNRQNQPWYGCLKSIPILSSHIHTGLLDGHYLMKILFKIIFTAMHATFLTHFATVVWYPSIWQAVQIMKLHIIHLFPPISSVFNSNIILVTLSSTRTSL